MSRLTAPPTLSNTDALPFDQLPPALQAQGSAATAKIGEFGLAWREHQPTGLFFLGVALPELEDHNRWVIMASPDEDMVWYGIRAEGVPHPRAINRGGLRMHSASMRDSFMMDYLGQLAANYDSLAAPAAQLGVERPAPHIMTAYSLIAADISIEKAAAIFRYELPWLHGILHHYDTWLLDNPEYTGMPRDIVMRMHGLDFYRQYRYV